MPLSRREMLDTCPNRRIWLRRKPKRVASDRRRVLSAELLESRRLLANDLAFQNPGQPVDVNHDLRVTPVDALQVITHIQRNGNGGQLPSVNEGRNFPDTNGDNLVTPIDALRVINRLNRLPQEPTALLAARLVHDSAPGEDPNLDFLTNQYGLEFGVTNGRGSDRLELRINGGESNAFVDAGTLPTSGSLVLSESQLDALAGSPLSDGQHSVDARIFGGEEIISFIITLDRSAPTASPIILTPESDSGISDSDGITAVAQPTLNGFTESGATVEVLLNGEIFSSFVADGAWQVTAPQLDDGTYVISMSAVDAAGNRTTPSDLSILIDTEAPNPPSFSLAAASDTGELGDNITEREFIALVGQTEENANVHFSLGARVTTATDLGDFAIHGLPLLLGDNTIVATATDLAGNESSYSGTIIGTVPEDWLTLQESSDLFAEQAENVLIGPDAGSRSIRFDVRSRFDTSDPLTAIEDLLLVYVVDPNNPANTLVDRGNSGTAAFAMAGEQIEFPPGIVTFDGRSVTIDVSGLGRRDSVQLRFQLINSDRDSGTLVAISPPVSASDPAGTPSPTFSAETTLAETGSAVQLEGYFSNENLIARLANVRLDSSSGLYQAELLVQNDGADFGRDVVVIFSGLPSGVSLLDSSGVTESGEPYLNIRGAIPRGGLRGGQSSAPVLVSFSNPSLIPFVVSPNVLTGGPNTAPQLDAIGPLSLVPGGAVTVELNASDTDGDPLTYTLRSEGRLPRTTLIDDHLTISPAPGDEGSYSFSVVASDGAVQVIQPVTLEVLEDTIGTTRIGGSIFMVDGTPVSGLVVEVGPVQTLTNSIGEFELDLGSGIPASETLRVRGDLYAGGNLPFIAEKFSLLLERGLYAGHANQIIRPIYLPELDVAGGTQVDPASDTQITQSLAGGGAASVVVASGTLLDQQGLLFDGVLSITEVPRELTPASLPPGLLPDTVVTIQPGEMFFASPAPLTLPNRAGWAPRTVMDLWSINPTTGAFEIVGTMRVSDDGQRVETTAGGIRNSSWHFFSPPPAPNPKPNPDAGPEDGSCAGDSNGDSDLDPPDQCDSRQFTSTVNLLDGSVTETHTLVGYQVLGAERNVTLVYNSLHADPRPIISFGYDNAPTGQRAGMFGSVTISDGTRVESVRGIWHTTTGDANGAIQVDLSEWPSGQLPYSLRIGLGRLAGPDPGDRLFTGTTESFDRSLAHVNRIDSPFGAGWAISGTQEIIENADRSVLLINGNNTVAWFSPPEADDEPYGSPPGDFSTLTKNETGQFVRTFSDQSVSRFNAAHLLESYADRNGRTTQYSYDEYDRLTTITDPVGLETTITYGNSQVTITDPVGRVTALELDMLGNLIKITDPDQTSRQFEYDDRHLMTRETDQRGSTELTFYDQYGRATRAIRKDGSERQVRPAQTQVEISQGEFSFRDFNFSPTRFLPLSAKARDSVSSEFVDPNGNVIVTGLNPLGLPTNHIDGEGSAGSTIYNDDNLPIEVTDGNGNTQHFRYDDAGNIIETWDDLAGTISYWVGSDGGDWHRASNWSARQVPNENTRVIIDTPGTNSITIRDDISVKSLEVGSASSNITLNFESVSLGLFGGMDTRALTMSEGGHLAPGSTINVFGTMVIAGPFLNQGDILIQIKTGFKAGAATRSELSIANPESFENFGLIKMMQAPDTPWGSFQYARINAGSDFVNPPDGIIQSSVGTGHLNVASLENQGTLLIAGGSLSAPNPVSNLGLVDVTSGGVIFTGEVQQAGLIRISPSGYVSVQGSAGSLSNHGIIRADAENALRVTSGGTFHPSAGRFSHAAFYDGGVLGSGTNYDAISIYGSNTATGDFVNAPSGEVRLEGTRGTLGVFDNATLTISDGDRFQNHGTIIMTADNNDTRDNRAVLVVSSGTLVNAADGLIEAIRDQGGGRQIYGSFENQGTIQVLGYTYLHLNGPTTNTGTIEVNEGTLAAGNELNNAGLIDIFATGVFENASSNAHVRNTGVILASADNHFRFTNGATFHPLTGRFTHAAIYNGGLLGDGTNLDAISVYQTNTVTGDFINGPSGTLRVQATRGGLNIYDNATLIIDDPTKFENQGTIQLTADNNDFRDNRATLTTTAGDIVNGPEGTIELLRGGGAVISIPRAIVNQGTIRLTDISHSFVEQVTSSGQFQIARGTTLTTSGGLALQEGSLIMQEVSGVNGGSAGRLNAQSMPTLAGDVYVVFANETDFNAGSTIPLVYFTEPIGTFDSVQFVHLPDNATVEANYEDTGMELDVVVSGNATPPNPLPVNPFDEWRATAAAPPIRPDLRNLANSTADPGDRTRDPFDDPDLPEGTSPTIVIDRATTRIVYDTEFNQPIEVINPLGHRQRFEIDSANGNTLAAIDVIGLPDTESSETDDLVTQFTYTLLGQPDTITDPLGRVTDYDYDTFGRLTRLTYAMGTLIEASMGFAYDAAGNLSVITDENGHATSFTYDSLNRLTQLTEPDPDGSGPLDAPVTTFTYDARGNLVSTTDAAGSTSQSVYDALDQLVEQRDDQNNTVRFTYDAVGNLAATINPLGLVTSNVYDQRNRLIQTVDPDGGVTSFSYDQADNLTSIVDPVGNETAFTYDERNRMVAETDPLGNSLYYAYDLVDNLTQKIDRNLRVTNFQYDDVDRLIQETWVNTDDSVANEIDYSYDAVGNLLSVTDAFSALAFTYDSRDRTIQVDNAGTPGAANVVLDYAYDGVGNVLSVTDTIADEAGATTSYLYDALNRQIRITQSGETVSEKRVDMAYNALGQFASIDRFSNSSGTNSVVRTTYAYDELNRLIDLRHSNAATDVAFFEYEYDASSRITSINDIDGLTRYSHDDRDQLIGADRGEDDVRGDERYVYDANGNRLKSQRHGDGYVTGDANRLLSDGTYNYEYDNEGNMIRRTEIATGDYRTFEWDHRNRLASVIDMPLAGDATQTVTYRYDSLGRRIEKELEQNEGNSLAREKQHFIYDWGDLILLFGRSMNDGDQYHELQTRYLHGPDVDQVFVAENAIHERAWYLQDNVATTRALVQDDGEVAEYLGFDSFGNAANESSAFSQFMGREIDPDTGLTYFRARFFDSSIGRFTSEDPIRSESIDANFYRFVVNQPTALVDPTGLDPTRPNLGAYKKFRTPTDEERRTCEYREMKKLKRERDIYRSVIGEIRVKWSIRVRSDGKLILIPRADANLQMQSHVSNGGLREGTRASASSNAVWGRCDHECFWDEVRRRNRDRSPPWAASQPEDVAGGP